LCMDCFHFADHEDDYGVDFGSTPRLRISVGKPAVCDCIVPCDTPLSSLCLLCCRRIVFS
jgi:hypothetical protein